MRLYPRRSLEGVALASKDKSAISGLRFDGNQTIATNGHVLITTTNKGQQNPADFPTTSGLVWSEADEPFTVETKDVKQAIKNLPNKKEINACPVFGNVAIGRQYVALGDFPEHNKNHDVALTTTQSENPCFRTISTRPVEGKFPDTKHVIPDYSNGAFVKVSVNPKLVKDITTLLAKDYDKITLHIHRDKSESPIVITASDTEFDSEVILMPMRQDK